MQRTSLPSCRITAMLYPGSQASRSGLEPLGSTCTPHKRGQSSCRSMQGETTANQLPNAGHKHDNVDQVDVSNLPQLPPATSNRSHILSSSTH